MPGHWLVKNTRDFTGTLGGLVVNRDEGKQSKQHQPQHSLHSVSCLQNGQNYSSLPPNRTKGIIKLEKKAEEIPRSVWEKEEMEEAFV